MVNRLLCLLMCVGSLVHAQQCEIFYVSPSGATSGDAGTPDRPAALTYALSLADGTLAHLRLAVGRYTLDQPLSLKEHIILEGGFLPQENWAKTNTDSTVLFRSSRNPEPNPNRIVAIYGRDIAGFRLHDLRVVVADAPASLYGIHLTNCRDYALVRCVIRTGHAGDGQDGEAGRNGFNGQMGGNGGLGCRQCDPDTPPYIVDGGRPGNTWSSGLAAGGRGGDGGARGTGSNCVPILECADPCAANMTTAPDGEKGADGNGPGAGVGGVGRPGLNYCASGSGLNQADVLNFINSCASADPDKYRGQDGVRGRDGADGTDGVHGTAKYENGFFYTADGTDGRDGEHGSGGGGGGGGASIGGIPRLGVPGVIPDANSAGGGGGGGGEGGKAGLAGRGGSGGEGSFAVFLWNNGPNGLLRDCRLEPGGGGEPGKGGAGGEGGQGGGGGKGGNDVLMNGGDGSGCQGGAGGDGGDGGKGGDGGDGGDGAPGPTVALYQSESGAPVMEIGRLGRSEFPVKVHYAGCTHAPISLETTVTGGIFQWRLNGEPAGAEGRQVETWYATVGRKSFSLFVDGVAYSYTEFLNLRHANEPQHIDADVATTCEIVRFSTQTAAKAYDWRFPGGMPATSDVFNPGAVRYAVPGRYPAILKVETACCGASLPDTFWVQVFDGGDISLPPDDTLCRQEPGTLLTVPNWPEAVYSWKKDGVPIAGAGASIQADEAGVYDLQVTIPGGCVGRDTFQLTRVDSLPVRLGPDVTICADAPPPLLKTDVIAERYFWTRNGLPVGNSRVLQTTLPGVYKLTVTTASGCVGSDELLLSISRPEVRLGPDRTECAAELTLDAGTVAAAYSWLKDGAEISNQKNLTVAESGAYVLDIIDAAGCHARDTVILTLATPLHVTIDGPTALLMNEDGVFVARVSPTADSLLWNFGDGGISRQPTAEYAYTKEGRYRIFLVAFNGLCRDTAFLDVDVRLDCAAINLKADFSFSPDTVDLNINGLTRFVAEGAGVKFWQVSGATVGFGDTLWHSFDAIGEYIVQLTVVRGNCTDSVEKRVHVVRRDKNVGRALPPASSIQIYPNPFAERFEINGVGPGATLMLTDAAGRLLWQSTDIQTLPALDAGVYFLRIAEHGRVVSVRLICVGN